ncbi:MAG: asparagine synthase (glutamine-hydrolyzing) [Acidobacteria bacterium]|nr:MAG: asparagine synthase (glutamine-hydrolyzing) [Acidobacteriota bacterium]REJ99070.1 MAG: asparagine synthase (glutamine-hydrolyzing) [Acidobacteriota bacterium]REK16210.1 MAG: asparagine synthase (glutamine-hydrolyzing) [Acidobacteriota bacterium]REK43891.1 MAG: asparagine synthase (glutamine-hydrolyzing) [Acidobacteriota bacterium]
MCGIVGFTAKYFGDEERGILERMNGKIIHRGPDEDGFYLGEGFGMAMRRLSIIDLSGGQQPIHTSDRSKWIVYNGEFYNYRELRRKLEEDGHEFYTNSDTEVILHLYDKYGSRCVEYLRGMFAFAVWDEKERSLFLARDRTGQKPLLYSRRPDGHIVFGSEFQAILEHPDISREVDPQAIDDYMSYQCVPAPSTAFREMRKLEPGHWLIWKNGQIRTERYWKPDFSKKIRISEEEAVEETSRVLQESVKLRMISEVPLGAFLSGGVDSSTIVALMARVSDRPVKTFSIGFEEQDYSELKYARKVAEHVGAEYNEFIVKPNALEVIPKLVEHYGEPYSDSSAIPTYYVSQETRKHVTVALNGDGGDESFAGYERHAAMRLAEFYQRVPSALRTALFEAPISVLPTSEIKRSRIRDVKRFLSAARLAAGPRYSRWMTTFDDERKSALYSSQFRSQLNGNGSRSVFADWLESDEAEGIVDRCLLTDMMTYLPNDLLVKVDIASMANSLEARSPFLDHKVIEFAASLPEELKMRRIATKSLLKKVASQLVPREVIYRPKMGFGVPIGNWFRGELKGFIRDILQSNEARSRGLFKQEEVDRMTEEHVSAKKDHTFQIWSLLMLELWFQKFVDR